MAEVDQSGIVGKIRDKPITAKLAKLLSDAADAAGIEKVFVYSGGQPGTTGQSTGGPRHNGGRAADLNLIKGGVVLSFTNAKADPGIIDFVTAAAALGSNGIGAGTDYMGPRGLHVGFGLDEHDLSEVVWGKNGKSVNAPQWLRDAAKAGWSGAASFAVKPVAVRRTGPHEVIARGGLFLRKGPGTGFSVADLVPFGQTVNVLGYSGVDPAWARVDLQNDGAVDGHMFAEFLQSAVGDVPE